MSIIFLDTRRLKKSVPENRSNLFLLTEICPHGNMKLTSCEVSFMLMGENDENQSKGIKNGSKDDAEAIG